VLGEGEPEHLPQAFDLAVVAFLHGLPDRPLGEPVPQHIDGVHAGHSGLPLGIAAALHREAVPVARQPPVEGVLVGDFGAERLGRSASLGRVSGQGPEEPGVVHAIAAQQRVQGAHQVRILGP
jgi:hypothetical protein